MNASTSVLRPVLANSRLVLQRGILRPVAAVSSRDVSTATMSSQESIDLLNKQRALRPNSPWHIYKPQLTSMSSIANRATGGFLSAAFYGLFLGHLVLPAFGVPFDSATLLSAFADLPTWLKLSAKSLIAFPMSYHTLNGLRHLSWDMGYLLNLKTSYTAGWLVIGASVASTVGLLAL